MPLAFIGSLIVLLLFPTAAQAQSTGGRDSTTEGGAPNTRQEATTKNTGIEPVVKFTHLGGSAAIHEVELNHGQPFLVRIEKTCLAAFEYSYEPVKADAGQKDRPKAKKDALAPKELRLIHNQQFGGYVIHIVQKQGADPKALCEDGDELVPLSFIIVVRQQRWNLSFSGAFTLSSLTDPVYSIRTEDGTKTVVEEPDKRDSRRLGVASFVHLFHDRVKWKQLQPALGFGLGISSENRTEYMIGGGMRFGDRATVNFGRMWGSTKRLPNGVTLGTPIADDNVLNNSATRTASSWFFAISYSFVDTRDNLAKPFAPDMGQAVPATPKVAPGP